MQFPRSLCAAVVVSALLAACGGGSGGSDSPGPGPGTGTGSGGGAANPAPAPTTASFKAFGQLDPASAMDAPTLVGNVPVNAGGLVNGAFFIGTLAVTLTPTSDGGYTVSNSVYNTVLTRAGLIELCNASGLGDGTNGLKSRYVLLPGTANAVAVTALKGRSFKLYEDCAQTPRSTALFQADGTVLEREAGGASETISAAEVAATFGTTGFTTTEGTSIARAFQLASGKYAFVSHGLPGGAGNARGYVEFFVEE
ncbi:hypothetical protein [Acidovorax sp. FG27]|uniref:hypothetical protein n=1 Tax=Acidovorax sp. FG27 TaxID=3133652 RepID=UPI0030E8CF0D